MKNYLKIILPLLVVGLLAFMIYKIVTKINHKQEVAAHIKTIPNFEYQNSFGGLFTNRNLKKDTPTVFVYFNSDCEHCQAEAEMIAMNLDKFSNLQLIFVSFEKPENIKKFALHYKLTDYDNIDFLCDSKVSFATTFDVQSVPCLVLYDKNQHLIEKIKGQIKVETLIKKLEIRN